MTSTYVALLRAVNVGGTGSLPAKDLVRILEKAGGEDVRTYIQSGNAVFRVKTGAARLPAKIRAAISRKLGFAPEVLVLRLEDLESALDSSPFPEADTHLTFLASAPKDPDLAALDKVRKASERFALKGRVFYLHAPEGVGRSKLFARIERSLGVAGTARNWRTACKLLEMAREVSD